MQHDGQVTAGAPHSQKLSAWASVLLHFQLLVAESHWRQQGQLESSRSSQPHEDPMEFQDADLGLAQLRPLWVFAE